MVAEERNPFLEDEQFVGPHPLSESLSDLFEDDDADITITTCSGCGQYADFFGPHIGCKYEGEFM